MCGRPGKFLLAVIATAVFAMLAAVSPVATAAEPDDSIGGATPLALGSSVEASFSPAGERDYYSLALQGGRTYSFEASATGGSGADPRIAIGDLFRVSLSNDDVAVGATGAAMRWSCLATGTYYLLADDPHARGGTYALRADDLGVLAPGSVLRIGGANRYAVARNIANVQLGGWSTTNVIVASGLDRSAADPLAASGLAGTLGAPVLLVNQDSATRALPLATRSAILAIKAARASAPVKFWFVGGTASVPAWVRWRIQALYPGCSYERLSGADRYSCAAAVAARMRGLQGATPTMAFIANGETGAFFFDALAASPVAYSSAAPVLLTKKSSLPAATRAELAAGAYAARYAVGNTYEIAGSVVSTASATRIGVTATRYDRELVARRFAEWAVASGLAARSRMVVANKLPDGLTGGCLAGEQGGVALFTRSATVAGAHLEDFTQLSRGAGAPDVTVVGGSVSVSDGVLSRLLFLAGG